MLSGVEFQGAVDQLVEQGVTLPYGVMPGSRAGGLDQITTRAQWLAYTWNPPQHLRPGTFIGASAWTGPVATIGPFASAAPFNETLYGHTGAIAPPAVPDSRAEAIPAGWRRRAPANPCWAIARIVNRLPADAGYSVADPAASAKPTWEAIVAAAGVAGLRAARRRAGLGVEAQESQRITNAYLAGEGGPATTTLEILYRLRASAVALVPKHAERNRLHARALALRAWVDEAARTSAELESFDASDDAHWDPPVEE